MPENADYTMTLIVRTDTPGLQYDINGIVRSFFPEYTVRVLEPGEKAHDESLYDISPFMTVTMKGESHLEIMYLPGESARLQADPSSAQRGETFRSDVCPRHFEFHADSEQDLKNVFKGLLYDVLAELTGRTLPWGNLTGVRPTKIAMTRMQAGDDDLQIKEYMQGRYRVSDEKTDLAIDIAHRESALLSKLDPHNGYSLYVGIPFCPTTCLYCSFTSNPISVWRNRADEYLDALSAEFKYVAEEFETSGAAAGHPDTVYIGGGTPTSLDEYHFEKLLDRLTGTIDISQSLEFTCEAGRPDSITPEKLKIMKKYGVTRMSVNPQTMQQKTLDLIGRRTTTEQIYTSFHAAREAGFDNINMDIILGLPGEDEHDAADTLRQIESLGPDSLTVHSLAIKRASALKQRLDEIGIEALKNTDETMALASEAAYRMGMVPYYLYRQKNMSGNFENTGFSVPGKEGIYNILIMEEVQTIVACGAGTVTKRVDHRDGHVSGISRCENVKDVNLYISQIEEMTARKRELFR